MKTLHDYLQEFDDKFPCRTRDIQEKFQLDAIKDFIRTTLTEALESVRLKEKESHTLKAVDQHGNGYIGGKTNSEYNQAVAQLDTNIKKILG